MKLSTQYPTSCLNISVSCVKNYYSKYPKDVNLLTWLNSSKYAPTIQQLRNTTDAAARKRLKGSLPAITPSGLFTRVDEQHLVSHSGFVQFDIDYKAINTSVITGSCTTCYSRYPTSPIAASVPGATAGGAWYASAIQTNTSNTGSTYNAICTAWASPSTKHLRTFAPCAVIVTIRKPTSTTRPSSYTTT